MDTDTDGRTAREKRQRQVAANEAAFRDRNERLERRVADDPDLPELVVFACECGNAMCSGIIKMRIEEYEAVRSDSRRFAVVAGHVYHEAERVVATTDRYQVVEKLEEAEEVVDAADQRFPGPDGGRSDRPTPAADDRSD